MSRPISLKRKTKEQSLVLAALLVVLILATWEFFVPTLSILLLVFAGLLFGVFVHDITAWPAMHTTVSYPASFRSFNARSFIATDLGDGGTARVGRIRRVDRCDDGGAVGGGGDRAH